MKRFFTILSISLIVFLIPFSGTKAQEQKSEQKIKIIVADGSGTRVIIDTVFQDGHINDSIRLKNGKMIYINKSDENRISKYKDGSGHIYVHASSEGKGQKNDANTVTVVSSDDMSWTIKESEGKDNKTERVVYVTDRDDSDKKIEKAYTVKISKDDGETSDFQTRSIIAKDGMVVTVEGNDEEKVSKLVREIQIKMGVNPPDADTKDAVKVETGKRQKK